MEKQQQCNMTPMRPVDSAVVQLVKAGAAAVGFAIIVGGAGQTFADSKPAQPWEASHCNVCPTDRYHAVSYTQHFHAQLLYSKHVPVCCTCVVVVNAHVHVHVVVVVVFVVNCTSIDINNDDSQ